jgi:hypothetical protein
VKLAHAVGSGAPGLESIRFRGGLQRQRVIGQGMQEFRERQRKRIGILVFV